MSFAPLGESAVAAFSQFATNLELCALIISDNIIRLRVGGLGSRTPRGVG